ncbi:hypothetical protein FSP39_012321 [Pinctada imbricata]|uniref:Nose resistant-to-fluoxetine protein N-terminal domain-containing protein n=1 Tax=Pinctada imbricata TaxID=66713 RepID=A0AA88XV75_PINIB|nr:hypothetical protein FSP39_012321 [Pinctada imbricata]
MAAHVKLVLILTFTAHVTALTFGGSGNNYGELMEEFITRGYSFPTSNIDLNVLANIKDYFQDGTIRTNAKMILEFLEELNRNLQDGNVRAARNIRAAGDSQNNTSNDQTNFLTEFFKGITDNGIGSLLTSFFGNGTNQSQNLSLSTIQRILGVANLTSVLPQAGSSQLINTTMSVYMGMSSAFSSAPQECRNDLISMVGGIATGQGWALSMLDALGKPPAGVTTGRLKWWGDFDECQAVDTPTLNGQYCKVQVFIAGYSFLEGAQISLEEGVCMPRTCPSETIKGLMFPVFLGLSQSLPQNIRLYVYNVGCRTEHLDFDGKAVAMTIVCSGIVLVLIVSTLFDVYIAMKTKSVSEHKQQQTPDLPKLGTLERTLLAFSLYTNGKKLLNSKKSAGTLTSLHGIRFLSMTWVILGHTLALNTNIFDNLATVAPVWISWTSFQAIFNALVSVDTFFAISGLLVAYLTLKELNKVKSALKFNWFMFYFHRFWRLTPVYMLLLGIFVAFGKYMGEGPGFYQGDIPACTEKWWTNLLYINNFVYPDDTQGGCMAHTWYLANDMQFYILSPLIIVPFFINPIFGGLMSVLFLGATWGACIYLGVKYQWPPITNGGGVDSTNQGKMFGEYYIKPYGRMGPYIVGLVTGYILYRIKCKCRMKPVVAVLGWIVATVIACLVLYGLHDAFNGNPLSVGVSVFYMTVHRTVWGACVCWVVFACATGNGGYINTLLSWKPFIPLARLTYCAYLLHPLIMYIYSGSLREPMDMTMISLVFLYFGFLVTSMAFAFIASVCIESPMMALEKVVFGRSKKKPKDSEKESQVLDEKPIIPTVFTNGYSNKELDPSAPELKEEEAKINAVMNEKQPVYY